MLHISHGLLLDGALGFKYLDPGSGSVLLQVILAAILGIGIVVRTQWAKIRSLFARGTKTDKTTHEDK